MSERILPLSDQQAQELAGHPWSVLGRTLFFKPVNPSNPSDPPWKSGAEGKAYPLLDHAGTPAAYLKFFTIDSPKRVERTEWLTSRKLYKWMPHLSAAPSQWLDSRDLGRPAGVNFDFTGCLAAVAPGETWLELKYRLNENPVLLTLEQRWRLITELVAALAVLEKAGVVHGDLAPSNLLIDLAAPANAPMLRLIDFDAFAIPTEPDSMALTVAEGGTYGTKGYCPPELAEQAEAGDLYITPYSDRHARDMLFLEFLFARAGHNDHPPAQWDRQKMAVAYIALRNRCQPERAELMVHLDPAQVFSQLETERPSSAELVSILARQNPPTALTVLSKAPRKSEAPEPAPPAPAVVETDPVTTQATAPSPSVLTANPWAMIAVILGGCGVLAGATAVRAEPQAKLGLITYFSIALGLGGLCGGGIGIRRGLQVLGVGMRWAVAALVLSLLAITGGTVAMDKSAPLAAAAHKRETEAGAAAAMIAAEAEARSTAEKKAAAETEGKRNAQEQKARESVAAMEETRKLQAQRMSAAIADRARQPNPEDLMAARLPEAKPRDDGRLLANARENSLGMKFLPVPGTDVLFSVWDTRVRDYEVFLAATGPSITRMGPSHQKTSFTQSPTHPVVNMSWEDAQALAQWLTDKERREGILTGEQYYRLPKDWEWSVAVDLDEPRTGTPKEKHLKIRNQYPWGTQWPPPPGFGKYFAAAGNHPTRDSTSPVGTFPANRFGLYDMGGNTWQWCEDAFDPTMQYFRVLRGGSFLMEPPDCALSSYRNAVPSGIRGVAFGFRLVLVGVTTR